jgi:hypothetical protein
LDSTEFVLFFCFPDKLEGIFKQDVIDSGAVAAMGDIFYSILQKHAQEWAEKYVQCDAVKGIERALNKFMHQETQ